jgi:uncharacterized repeat protein (TIGR03806 family)
MSKKLVYVILGIGVLISVSYKHIEEKPKYKNSLSEYGFFSDLANQIPNEGVIPYDLNTPLFSDYAYKKRFIAVPDGKTIAYNDTVSFEMPIGTKIIKTFYYPFDERKPEKGNLLMETRLLIHEEDGWTALPYIWNDEQTDAYLSLAGDLKPITWVNKKGKKQKLDYLIPNKNQCKGCHIRGKEMKPIGPAARHLNKDYNYNDGLSNQLKYWKAQGILANLPADFTAIPQNALWEDLSSTLDLRARSWLDINCGHCHSSQGPANTSGLFLDIHQTDPYKFGILKPPVAAGRGSGDRAYDIVPGKPDQSILVYRMEENDPGIRMPEIGRTIAHKEGLQLIKDWIKEME